jgi:hypothetical protein
MVGRIWGQTRHLDDRPWEIWGQTRCLGARVPEERGQARYSGARAFCRDLSMHLPTQIRGQTRCPVHRSGTFNVQRSTRNFQRGDRKGVWWAEYGDRHGIWTTGHGKYGDRHANWAPGSRKNGDRHDIRAPGLFAGTCQCTCRPRYGDRHDVRYADRERSTCNVQLATFNGVTERVQGGRNMGTDTELRRHVSLGCSWPYCGVAICSVRVFSGGLRREFLQATEPQEIFSSPAAQSFLINGGKHRVFRCQATLVPATPGWGTASFG